MSEPLKNTRYQLTKIDPFDFSYTEALKLGELQARTFQNNGLFIFWHGPDYAYGDDLNAIQRIHPTKDPRWRLKELVRRANAYTRLIHAWAVFFKTHALDPGAELSIVYDGKKLVAFALWQLPPILTPPRSISQHFRAWFSQTYMSLWDRYVFLFSRDHPLQTPRLLENRGFEQKLREKTFLETEKDMVGKTREQLAHNSCVYPQRDHYVYLSFLAVSAQYQRQGIGQQLLRQTLDKLPKDDVEIEHEGTKVSAPQKVYVKSTKSGIRLYQSVGFELLLDVNMPTYPGASLHLMQALR